MAQKPQKTQFLDPPRTIGDHIKKGRLQLGWGATHVAQLLKVSTDTVYNWEHNRSRPSIRFMPGIQDFLGHALDGSMPNALGEKIKRYRIKRGLSQKKLARSLGIDSTTLGRWERNEGRPNGKLKIRVEPFLRTLQEMDGAT